jgi:hypothetical protein
MDFKRENNCLINQDDNSYQLILNRNKQEERIKELEQHQETLMNLVQSLLNEKDGRLSTNY